MLEFDGSYKEEGCADHRPLLSIVTPAYNEAENLPMLYAELTRVLGALGMDWEWLVVDDHSTDSTFEVVADIARRDGRVHGLRLARNFGAHTAATCGLNQARGECVVMLAADLQDPPDLLPDLLAKWRAGAQVVWAARNRCEGDKTGALGFSRLYYWLMRRVVGIKEMPKNGADFFLIDRRVLKAFREFRENNVSIQVLLTWMGFRQATITYDKQARRHGRSGWNLEKKVKLVVDSVASFTYLPIRLMSYVGVIVAIAGFIYAGVVAANAMAGSPVQGWSSLMVVVLVIGGIQMLMMGLLGEYLWRALDESRRRPRYLIEDATASPTDSELRRAEDNLGLLAGNSWRAGD